MSFVLQAVKVLSYTSKCLSACFKIQSVLFRINTQYKLLNQLLLKQFDRYFSGINPKITPIFLS